MLSDATVKSLRPREKPFKVGDAAGLYILVSPTGGRLWRLNYMVRGKQKTLALGSYPAVSLADARAARDAAKAQLRAGADPVETVKVEKAAARVAVTTFADVAADWYARKMVGEGKAANTLRRETWLLGILNVDLGGRPIGEIEAPDLLQVLRRAEAAGNAEAAKRACSTASAVFRFGVATGKCRRNPAADLKGALTSRKARPRSAIIEPSAVGKLLRDVDGYQRPVVRQALQLLALTFVRPSELALAEWSEFGADGTWTVPAGRMKMRRAFHIPLPRQALVILAELRAAAGGSRYVFPSRRRDRPIQASKMVKALRAMGYDASEVTAHGFRSTASTLLNDEGTRFAADVIELCLAHKPPGVRGIYNRSLRWPERVALMSWWAERLDALRARGEIMMLPKKKSKAAVA